MMTKPNTIRFVSLLLAFGAALVWPVMRIRQFECATDYTLFRFKVTLYDPYDLMRGRYLRFQVLPDRHTVGEKLDVSWQKPGWAKFADGKNGFARIAELSDRPIPGGVKVRAYSVAGHTGKNGSWSYRVEYPFSRYFINEQDAAEAEAIVRNALRAKRPAEVLVRVYPDGNFMIEELRIDGKPLREHLRPRQQ